MKLVTLCCTRVALQIKVGIVELKKVCSLFDVLRRSGSGLGGVRLTAGISIENDPLLDKTRPRHFIPESVIFSITWNCNQPIIPCKNLLSFIYHPAKNAKTLEATCIGWQIYEPDFFYKIVIIYRRVSSKIVNVFRLALNSLWYLKFFFCKSITSGELGSSSCSL